MWANNRFLQPIQYLARNVRLMTTNRNTDLILTKEVNNTGLLILNRPSALNAFDKIMIDKVYDVLCNWNVSKSMIIVRGNGGAFCAGGDVKLITQYGLDYGLSIASTEYTAMHMINNFKFPYIALMDGITMGGGVGLAIYGKYRIATERTHFAMPENKIG